MSIVFILYYTSNSKSVIWYFFNLKYNYFILIFYKSIIFLILFLLAFPIRILGILIFNNRRFRWILGIWLITFLSVFWFYLQIIILNWNKLCLSFFETISKIKISPSILLYKLIIFTFAMVTAPGQV